MDCYLLKNGVSREYAQKLRHYFPKIDDAGVGVVGVSLGTVDAAKDFCAETGFPLDNMFMVSLGLSLGLGPSAPPTQDRVFGRVHDSRLLGSVLCVFFFAACLKRCVSVMRFSARLSPCFWST